MLIASTLIVLLNDQSHIVVIRGMDKRTQFMVQTQDTGPYMCAEECLGA